MSIAKSVSWNYAGAIGEALIGVLLVGFIVRHISVAEYGLLLLFMSLCSLVYLLDLGMGSLLVQEYVRLSSDHRAVSELLSTAFVILAGIGAVGALVVAGLALALPGPFKIPAGLVREASGILIWVGVATAISCAGSAWELLYQAFNRFDRLNQLQMIVVVLRAISTVILLAKGYGVVSLAILQAALSLFKLVSLVVALPVSVPGVRIGVAMVRMAAVTPTLRLGGWAILDNVMRQFASVSDSFVLGVFGSVASVATFAVGNKLPAQLSNFVNKGAIVILPLLAQHHATSDLAGLRRVFINAERLVLTGILPVVVLGGICARPLIQVWAGNDYLGAARVMQWLLIAALSLALEYCADLLLYASGEIRKASLIALWESVANVAVSLMLVSRYGAPGLAAGTAITHIAINVGWYTPAACRKAGISFPELMRSVVRGNAWLFFVLGIEAWAVYEVGQRVSATGYVVAGVVAGIVYLALWALTTVSPALRLGSRVRIDTPGGERLGSLVQRCHSNLAATGCPAGDAGFAGSAN